MKRSRLTLACAMSALATGAVLGTGVTAASAHGGHAHTTKVQLRFAAVSGATPVACGRPIAGLGTGGTTAQLQDLRFYISNVRLVRANGSSVPITLTGDEDYNLTRGGNRTTLIDLENGRGLCTEGDRATNSVISGTVPRGRYVGARMYLGVPFPLNHTDITTAPAPLDLTSMDWSWQSGRKFAKIELVDPGGRRGRVAVQGVPGPPRQHRLHGQPAQRGDGELQRLESGLDPAQAVQPGPPEDRRRPGRAAGRQRHHRQPGRGARLHVGPDRSRVRGGVRRPSDRLEGGRHRLRAAHRPRSEADRVPGDPEVSGPQSPRPRWAGALRRLGQLWLPRGAALIGIGLVGVRPRPQRGGRIGGEGHALR